MTGESASVLRRKVVRIPAAATVQKRDAAADVGVVEPACGEDRTAARIARKLAARRRAGGLALGPRRKRVLLVDADNDGGRQPTHSGWIDVRTTLAVLRAVRPADDYWVGERRRHPDSGRLSQAARTSRAYRHLNLFRDFEDK